jgi:hypothetical protein
LNKAQGSLAPKIYLAKNDTESELVVRLRNTSFMSYPRRVIIGIHKFLNFGREEIFGQGPEKIKNLFRPRVGATIR